MKNRVVDVAIIGAGTAGLAAYKAAIKAGVSAVIVEHGVGGTTCARVGCMPSKLLIAAADAAHSVNLAPLFGVHISGSIDIRGREVMNRVRNERDRFVSGVLSRVERIAEADRINGHAMFVNNTTLQIDDHTQITTKCVVVATGSRAIYPETYKQLGDRLIVSDDVFNWLDLPNSIAVIGPGIIGLELGQALHRLGVRVVVLGRGGRLGALSDPVILDYAVNTFKQEFILEPDAQILDVRRNGEQVTIQRTRMESIAGVGKSLAEEYDYVLAATGRAPNVQNIGLENTSLKLDSKGVPTYDPKTTQTVDQNSYSAIFMAGDAGNFIPLLHEATDEGRIAGENAARLAQGRKVEPGLRRAPLAIVFTDPQIGVVGGGFRALTPGTFVTGEVSFEDQGRARIMHRNKGLMHIYADVVTGRFLGAEIISPAAEHIAHLLAWALQNKMYINQMLEMPFYHPVLEEGLKTALLDADSKLQKRSNI